jgi:hypothetical protein
MAFFHPGTIVVLFIGQKAAQGMQKNLKDNKRTSHGNQGKTRKNHDGYYLCRSRRTRYGQGVFEREKTDTLEATLEENCCSKKI